MRRRRSGLNFGRQKKKVNMSVVKEVCVWIIEIAITLLVAFTLVYFVGLRTSVVGQSMAETLNGGDEILVNRFIYKVTDPRPNDVIVFLPNGNEKSHYYIKRVIAVPEFQAIFHYSYCFFHLRHWTILPDFFATI